MEMRDWALFNRAGMSYPCMIRTLCCLDHVPTTRYLDGKITPKGVVNILLIKDITNLLMGARTSTLGGPTTSPQAALHQPLPVKDYL